MLEGAKSRAKEQARAEAERRAATAKEEIGPAVLDLVESYFPEEAQERRKQTAAQTFLVGVAVGLLLGQVLGR